MRAYILIMHSYNNAYANRATLAGLVLRPGMTRRCVPFQVTCVQLMQVRLHYGHPDVQDKIFVMTQGSCSKGSKVTTICMCIRHTGG